MIREKIRKNKLLLAAVLIGFAGTFLVLGIPMVSLKRENQELKGRLEREIQEGIAGEIFRLHVVANSDREEDQILKLEVKETVMEYVESLVGEAAGLEETKEAVLSHLPQIEEKAGKAVASMGYDYPVKAQVERTYFPDKTYGDCTFPAGEYEALNVRIGEAAGHNWWCVLYPSLCFIDDVTGVVTEEKKEELREVLTEEEFLYILENPEEKEKLQIGFRWF